ncbi:MAG: sorbosone dehydrogenase family protein [Salinisphaera sp.]|jgi:glucose/arabinose dehydrogenase|nr:sorbosone dehydrogenase family protein [Salinisphaera sp.]
MFHSRSFVLPFILILAGALLAGCAHNAKLDVAAGTGAHPELPAPNPSLIPTVHYARAIHWAAGAKPVAAQGLSVQAFARYLDHPRWVYVLPNGDVLVAESNGPTRPKDATGIRGWVMKKAMARAGAGVPSPNKIILLRDTNGDGVADERHVFLAGLHSPFGMTLVNHTLYVADTDALLAFHYKSGETQITSAPRKIVDLPAGPIDHHWTKNVIASPNDKLLYVTVGSNSNEGENGMTAERGRAAIWQIDPATGRHEIYASGLRNPNGMAWVAQPDGGRQLWTVVNERDELGGDLVPDYMTSVKKGGFYGWPYSYFGQHIDKRAPGSAPKLVARAIVPDYALGPHTASLGLAYSAGNALGSDFAPGMFVGQHGSWNRKPRSGYKVVFVPFAHGQPDGKPIDVLTGFLNSKGQAQGRPVGVTFDKHGDLLVADDVGNAIWRVSARH